MVHTLRHGFDSHHLHHSMENTPSIHYRNSFIFRAKTWLDIQVLKVRYYSFLLGKCIRKNDFWYFGFIAKMNLALLFSRLAVYKSNPFVWEILKLENPTERIKILLNTYIFFRIDDDKADWEFESWTPQERLEYVISRMDATRLSKWDTNRGVDSITADVLELARKVWIEKELRKCLLMIFESLAFDAKRIQEYRESWKREFIPRTVLIDNYFRLDSLGTGQAMMLIFGDKPEEASPETINACVDFSDAVRMSYSLRDLIEDIRSWIVNIPEEDAQFFSISMNDVEELARHGDIWRASENIKSWIRSEIESAKALMQNSVSILDNPELSDLARMTMKSSYVSSFWLDIWTVEKSLGSDSSNQKRNTFVAHTDGIKILHKFFFVYRKEMDMSILESKKFFPKCHNLFVSYLAFSSTGSKEEVYWAAVAWFLSAYYDWVTDGPRPTPETQEKFFDILQILSPKTSVNTMVRDMMQKDISRTLTEDGLERWSTSFIAILDMMWILDDYKKKCDVVELWKMLQVIDDIDDYEQDKRDGDWNVFCTEHGRDYYDRMEECFSDNGKSIFPGAILPWFISRMRRKAKKILGIK